MELYHPVLINALGSGSPSERLVTSAAFIRHLPRKHGLGEMTGDDAAESVQNLVAIFVR